MALTISRHNVLTKANPEAVFNISALAPNEREMIVYGGNFDGASVKVSRRFAEKDDDGNDLPFVDVLMPNLEDVISIKAASAGYLFEDLARVGELKLYLINAGDNTRITVGVAF